MTHVTVPVLGYRIHSATATVLLLIWGVLLWANLRPTDWGAVFGHSKGGLDNVDPITKAIFFRGWPVSPCMVCSFHGMKYHPEEGFIHIVWLVNGGIALLILVPVAGICEWWCRNHLHFSTVLVLIVVGGALLGVNLQARDGETIPAQVSLPPLDPFIQQFLFRGSPFSPFRYPAFAYLALVADGWLALIILHFVAYSCEWRLQRHMNKVALPTSREPTR